jgi:hypothetical protein
MIWANLEQAFTVLKKYYPAVLTLAAISTIHYLQLRHIIIGDLSYLSDATFFFDMSTDFLSAIMVAGVISRVAMVCILANGLETYSFLLAFFLYGVRGLFKPPMSIYEERANEFNTGVVPFIDKRRQIFELIIFALVFYGIYCGYSFSRVGMAMLLLFMLFWISIAVRYVARDVKFSKGTDIDEIVSSLKLSDWKPRSFLILALTLVLISFLLATNRGHMLIGMPCSDLLLTDGNSDCLAIVGKSSQGVFGYESGDLDRLKFVPFGSIVEIIGHSEGEEL